MEQYNGMQQKILEINKYAVYIPCAGHSLNLVGRAAVDCCLGAVNFFRNRSITLHTSLLLQNAGECSNHS